NVAMRTDLVTSKTRTLRAPPSMHAMRLPSADQATRSTRRASVMGVICVLQLAASKSVSWPWALQERSPPTFALALPVAMIFPSGEKAAEVTGYAWRRSHLNFRPSRSHTFAVGSSAPTVTSEWASGASDIETMGTSCAENVKSGFFEMRSFGPLGGGLRGGGAAGFGSAPPHPTRPGAKHAKAAPRMRTVAALRMPGTVPRPGWT